MAEVWHSSIASMTTPPVPSARSDPRRRPVRSPLKVGCADPLLGAARRCLLLDRSGPLPTDPRERVWRRPSVLIRMDEGSARAGPAGTRMDHHSPPSGDRTMGTTRWAGLGLIALAGLLTAAAPHTS